MIKVKVEGLRELDEALAQLSKPTARAVLRRVLIKAAKPIQTAARAAAPRDRGDLAKSIITGTRLNRRQQRIARQEGKSFVEVYVGTSDPAAVPEEFGWVDGAAQPFMRPAWDAHKEDALKIIREELGVEIEKAAERARKRRS